MPANPTKIRFRRQALARVAPVHGVPSTRSTVGATARREAVVRRPIGRPILVCRWVAVEGGRLECRWSVEAGDGSSIEEPEGSWWVHRIGWSLSSQREPLRGTSQAIRRPR
jgi:hypothetical protein